MKKIILFIVLTFIISSSCKEEKELVEMWFEETQCANPWSTLPETENYLTEIRNFLALESIQVYAVGREKVEEQQTCAACNCLTGYIIVIRVKESDIGKASEFGFVTFEQNR